MRINRSYHRKLAFTLIELLVVVAIMAVLLALLVPALNVVRSKADNVVCISNLRQIGTGIIEYVADNNNTMPGPLYSAGAPIYYTNNPTDIIYVLSPYIGIPSATSSGTVVKLFECPARLRAKPYKSTNAIDMGPSYQLQQGFMLNNNWVLPFGYPNQTPPTLPLRITSLSGATNWAMVDIDQAGVVPPNGVAPTASWWYPTIPATPVHGNHRNAIFFDGHVQGLDTNWSPL